MDEPTNVISRRSALGRIGLGALALLLGGVSADAELAEASSSPSRHKKNSSSSSNKHKSKKKKKKKKTTTSKHKKN
ncbi:MAG: hypothetical protein U0821_23830 [Chloroflexota bacterium]